MNHALIACDRNGRECIPRLRGGLNRHRRAIRINNAANGNAIGKIELVYAIVYRGLGCARNVVNVYGSVARFNGKSIDGNGSEHVVWKTVVEAAPSARNNAGNGRTHTAILDDKITVKYAVIVGTKQDERPLGDTVNVLDI